MNNWLAVLRELPLDLVSVAHQPMTPRYSRPLDKCIYLLREGVLLGERSASFKQAVEIELFAENPNRTEKSPGIKSVDTSLKYDL
jgi:hypothetical protein